MRFGGEHVVHDMAQNDLSGTSIAGKSTSSVNNSLYGKQMASYLLRAPCIYHASPFTSVRTPIFAGCIMLDYTWQVPQVKVNFWTI